MARREWLSEAELRSQALTNDWDEHWVECVLEKGRGQSFDGEVRGWARAQYGEKVNRTWWEDPEELEHLVEVVWHYKVGTHEEYEIPCLYLTVYCPACSDIWAYHGPVPDNMDNYCFAEFVRERFDTPMTESRGVAQIAKGWQNQIKTQRDAFVNRSSVNTLPPLRTTRPMGKTRIQFGPGVQHQARPGEMEWMQIPQAASDAKEVTEATEREADRYFGRMSEHVPPTAQQVALEDLVLGWLEEIVTAMKITLQLAQQRLDEMVVTRRVGAGSESTTVTQEDIQGMYDFTIVLDPRDLDFELVIKKLDAWSKFILAADTVGVVDRAEFVRTGARLLDPAMADRLVGEPKQADENQARTVKAAWQSIVTGVEPTMAGGGGQNYEMQLQVLEQIMQNKDNQKRLQNNPDSLLLFQRFVKYLQFQAAQQQNAQTGRIGVPPLDWGTALPDGERRALPPPRAAAGGDAQY